MEVGRLGIWNFQLAAAGDEDLAEAVGELERLGYGVIWFPGGNRAFSVARRLLGASSRIVVATGIASIWRYDPAIVAAETDALLADHPARFLLGLGVSHPEAVNPGGEGPYRRPVSAMGRFLNEIGSERAQHSVLAALRPRMLQLAAARTRGAHPYFVPVEHTHRSREVLGAGPLLAPEQAVVLESDAGTARRLARGHMAMYLQLQNYANNLGSLGYAEEDIAGGGSDRLVDAIVVWGSAAEVARRIREHWDAGADHVCVQVIHEDLDRLPRDEWRALAEALQS